MHPQAVLLLTQPRPTAWPTFAYRFDVPCCPAARPTPVLFPPFSFSWFIVLLICTIHIEKITAPFPEFDQSDEPALFSRAISRSCSEPEKAAPTCTPSGDS